MNAVLPRVAPLLSVVCGQGIASATSFATVLALGRWGGEAELGQYALGWSCWFLAMSLGDTLVATPTAYFMVQKERLADDLPMAAAWGIALLAVGVGLALAAVRVLDVAGLAASWPALPAAVMAGSVREFVRRQWLNAGAATRVLHVDAAGSLLQLAGVAALAVAGVLSARGVFWVVAVSALLPLAPGFTPTRLRRFIAARHAAPHVLATLFGYGRWLLLGGLCHALTVQAYPWLAYAAGGERMAGVFAACSALANMLSPVLTALTNYFRPKFMAAGVRPPQDFARYVMRRAALFTAPALALAALLWLEGEWLLARLYGPSFADGAPALVWLALGTVAVSLAAPVQLAALALHAPVSNLCYHGSAVLWLGLAAVTASGPLTLLGLAQIYGAVNTLACVVLVAAFLGVRSARPRVV